jgi:acyl-CoA thioester hydrolase
MARMKLDLPPRFHFTTELVIRIGDINYGGHLGNDAVLSLVHEARIRFLKQHGYAENNVEGVGIIMSDAVVVYKAEGFHGDILTVEVGVGDFQNVSCDFYYRLSNRESGTEVARAKTGIVFCDYTAKKTVKVPAGFRKKFV